MRIGPPTLSLMRRLTDGLKLPLISTNTKKKKRILEARTRERIIDERQVNHKDCMSSDNFRQTVIVTSRAVQKYDPGFRGLSNLKVGIPRAPRYSKTKSPNIKRER